MANGKESGYIYHLYVFVSMDRLVKDDGDLLLVVWLWSQVKKHQRHQIHYNSLDIACCVVHHVEAEYKVFVLHL